MRALYAEVKRRKLLRNIYDVPKHQVPEYSKKYNLESDFRKPITGIVVSRDKDRFEIWATTATNPESNSAKYVKVKEL